MQSGGQGKDSNRRANLIFFPEIYNSSGKNVLLSN